MSSAFDIKENNKAIKPTSIGIIENFIDDIMIKKLLNKYESLSKYDDGLRINADTFIEQDFNSLFKSRIESILQKYFPNLTVCYAAIYSDYKPGGIHTDGYIKKPETKPLGKSFLIPLISTYDQNATIIFDQENEQAVSYNADTGLGNKGVITYDQIKLPKGKNKISKNFIDTYLKHLEIKDLPLSVASVLYWKTGSAIYWPRNKFHASAWFPTTEKNKRKAIVILTNEL